MTRRTSPRNGPLLALSVALLPLALLTGCGGGDAPASGAGAGGSGSAAPQFTAFQLEHGIGPIQTVVELGPLDEALVAQGKELFQYNCEACHMLDERFVGPALGAVLDRRSPAFVMNFVLNPDQMVREHPEGQKLLAEFPLVMPYQNITEAEARALVEYLRTTR
jgi:mono/diheme cytochrome c family protein